MNFYFPRTCRKAGTRGALLVLLALGIGLHAQPTSTSVPPILVSSYTPASLAESGAIIEQRLIQAKPDVMRSQQIFLEERYDLSNQPATGATMTHGKPVQQGPRTRLKPGMTWEMLTTLTPAEIRQHDIFPEGFKPDTL